MHSEKLRREKALAWMESAKRCKFCPHVSNDMEEAANHFWSHSDGFQFEKSNKCPICNLALTRQYKRDHVIWHFMDDLKQIVTTTIPHDGVAYKCMDCDYFIDKIENMARYTLMKTSLVEV